MDKLTWTPTQMGRFKELDVNPESVVFSTPAERNRAFQKIEKKQVKEKKMQLTDLLTHGKIPRLLALKQTLAQQLHLMGFTQVSTPTLITRAALARMTIDASHPLFKQIFWINEKQCLRPMLAPNLYSLMADFARLSLRPVRFFEIGSCFRKESDGALHNSEFTMLNLVEMGIQKEDCPDRLKGLAAMVADAAGVTGYDFETETSEVYGTTLDLVAGSQKLEVASGATGPHPLDAAWGITDTWVGMGFGIERLLMAASGDTSIGKYGKSLSYLDGIRLRI